MKEEADETAVSSSGIAIYIDSGDGYELSSNNTFPTSVVYELNTTKSSCTNGGTILRDSSNKTISVSVTSSDYCTLYYDYEETTLSNYIISLADTETTPDFSTSATTDEGVFAMEDDYGELSYYFRGAVENNYVYFAGFYWRIVRVNGDGTIRLIYDGKTSAYANGESSTDRYISESEYNQLTASPAYVGYMYGDLTDQKASSTYSLTMSSSSSDDFYASYSYDASTGVYSFSDGITGIWKDVYSDAISTYKYMCGNYLCSWMYEIESYSSNTKANVYVHTLGSSYEENVENKNPSTIKTVLDAWYESNLKETTYESYLADAIFCNDRSYTQGDGYSIEERTYYSAYTRLNNNLPELVCNQQNDAFTVSDTTFGNGDLTYPIGLITADEVVLAGNVFSGEDNNNYYLYTGFYYWTMTPSYFYIGLPYYLYSYPMFVLASGATSSYSSNSAMGVRPVINLKADVLISEGAGTMDSPFEVTLP